MVQVPQPTVAIDDGHTGRHPVPPSFDRFYVEEFRKVYAYLLATTGQVAVAEDLAQETFTRAYRSWDRVGVMDHPAAWVRVVAHNLAMSRFRRMASRTKALLRLTGQASSQVDALETPDHAFWAEVRRLPARQVQAVALFYVNDLPLEEVAAAMGCAVGTAKSHLHRARRTLRERIEGSDGGTGQERRS